MSNTETLPHSKIDPLEISPLEVKVLGKDLEAFGFKINEKVKDYAVSVKNFTYKKILLCRETIDDINPSQLVFHQSKARSKHNDTKRVYYDLNGEQIQDKAYSSFKMKQIKNVDRKCYRIPNPHRFYNGSIVAYKGHSLHYIYDPLILKNNTSSLPDLNKEALSSYIIYTIASSLFRIGLVASFMPQYKMSFNKTNFCVDMKIQPNNNMILLKHAPAIVPNKFSISFMQAIWICHLLLDSNRNHMKFNVIEYMEQKKGHINLKTINIFGDSGKSIIMKKSTPDIRYEAMKSCFHYIISIMDLLHTSAMQPKSSWKASKSTVMENATLGLIGAIQVFYKFLNINEQYNLDTTIDLISPMINFTIDKNDKPLFNPKEIKENVKQNIITILKFIKQNCKDSMKYNDVLTSFYRKYKANPYICDSSIHEIIEFMEESIKKSHDLQTIIEKYKEMEDSKIELFQKYSNKSFTNIDEVEDKINIWNNSLIEEPKTLSKSFIKDLKAIHTLEKTLFEKYLANSFSNHEITDYNYTVRVKKIMHFWIQCSEEKINIENILKEYEPIKQYREKYREQYELIYPDYNFEEIITTWIYIINDERVYNKIIEMEKTLEKDHPYHQNEQQNASAESTFEGQGLSLESSSSYCPD